MKKLLRKALRKAEELSRRLTIVRAGGQCERCGKEGYTEWCHYISRAYQQLKFHKNNTFRWCKECHQYLDAHPMEKKLWVIDRIGASAHEELMTLKNELHKPTVEYYENQIDELHRELNKTVCVL